jgi:dihydroorotate dehydrogenase
VNLYRHLLRPLFFRLPPEPAHELALHFLAVAGRCPSLLRLLFGPPPRAPLSFCGLDFPNPVGLAAGMDKNGVAISAWAALGFGFVEIGTITAHPQPGNPRPRLFRYPAKKALVNRMGFNNEGCEAVAARLRARLPTPGIPLGINLGKSKITPLEEAASDYLRSYQTLHEFGDYFVVNVSSPNTPGLRSLQAAEELRRIVGTLREWDSTRRKPLWVKLAPDLAPEDAVEAARQAEIAGADALIATNTTLDHDALLPEEDESGGLSGAPLREKARALLVALRQETPLPLVASGGIMSGADAADRLRLGAGLVQLYTGFVYEGPGLVREIVRPQRGA